jgi:hypothetical protein
VLIRCPICGREIDAPEDFPPRPFCSARCREIDLGNWLLERYVVSEPLTDGVKGERLDGGPDEALLN